MAYSPSLLLSTNKRAIARPVSYTHLNPPAIPHWWKCQPLIPTLLSQELKNYLKLNAKEKNVQIADQVIIDESAGEVVILSLIHI